MSIDSLTSLLQNMILRMCQIKEKIWISLQLPIGLMLPQFYEIFGITNEFVVSSDLNKSRFRYVQPRKYSAVAQIFHGIAMCRFRVLVYSLSCDIVNHISRLKYTNVHWSVMQQCMAPTN